MSTVTYLGKYASVREALDDAHAAGDSTFYAPNYDIYVRVVPYHGRVYHLTARVDLYWTWQEMRVAS